MYVSFVDMALTIVTFVFLYNALGKLSLITEN